MNRTWKINLGNRHYPVIHTVKLSEWYENKRDVIDVGTGEIYYSGPNAHFWILSHA